LEIISPAPYPYLKDMEVKIMTVIWGANLAIALGRLISVYVRSRKLRVY